MPVGTQPAACLQQVSAARTLLRSHPSTQGQHGAALRGGCHGWRWDRSCSVQCSYWECGGLTRWRVGQAEEWAPCCLCPRWQSTSTLQSCYVVLPLGWKHKFDLRFGEVWWLLNSCYRGLTTPSVTFGCGITEVALGLSPTRPPPSFC